jgi:sensor histidine kinase YesM
VRAHGEGPVLVIRVTDTGVGMAPGPDARSLDPDPNLDLDLDRAGHGPARGFGLTQVRERLATLYEGRASLSLEAAAPTGTSATLRLPLQP